MASWAAAPSPGAPPPPPLPPLLLLLLLLLGWGGGGGGAPDSAAAAAAAAGGHRGGGDRDRPPPPLLSATMRGDVHGVVKLLRGSSGAADDVDAADINGATALYWAAWKGDAAVIGELLGAGASAGRADHDGFTPLMVAAYYGHRTAVAQLLAAGADPTARDSSGKSALDWARAQRQPLPLRRMLELVLPPREGAATAAAAAGGAAPTSGNGSPPHRSGCPADVGDGGGGAGRAHLPATPAVEPSPPPLSFGAVLDASLSTHARGFSAVRHYRGLLSPGEVRSWLRYGDATLQLCGPTCTKGACAYPPKRACRARWACLKRASQVTAARTRGRGATSTRSRGSWHAPPPTHARR
jgi:hypothetical protein